MVMSNQINEVRVAIKRDLPDWRLSASQGHSDASDAAASSVSQRVAGVTELKNKFLGKGTVVRKGVKLTLSADDATRERRVVTVRVEPKSGGPAKVADFRNGRMTIVQG